MCHLHPQQVEQLSAGQCDITRNIEHDGGRTPGVAYVCCVVNPHHALDAYISLAIITALL